MTKTLSPIAALLVASALLLAGNGLQGTLVAVRANLESFPLLVIGLLMSAYYAGFVAGCVVNPSLVARVGHIRAFAAFAALASSAAIAHILLVTPSVWIFLRIVVGFCFAGLYMISESWINERATNENRGRLLSIYRLVDLGSIMLGQTLLTLADPAGFPLFCVASVLISIALIPVSLTAAVAPRPIEDTRFEITKVIHTSPLAAWTSLAAGLANGAFWGLAPIFIQNLGHDADAIAVFMVCVILGGVVMQFPLGMASDAFDRRLVLIAIAFGSAVASIMLVAAPSHGFSALLISGFLFGSFSLCLYSMAVAHANDHALQDDFVEISSGLLFLFGAGAIVGPLLAGLLISQYGSVALFMYTTTVQTSLFLYGLYRLTQRKSIPVEEQSDFVPVPRSTPQVLELDPRSDIDLEIRELRKKDTTGSQPTCS